MLTRRSFLRLLGVGGAAAAVAPAVLVPERKIWQVPANAPVPTRGWQADWAEIFKRAYAPFVDPNLGGYDDVVLINARRFGKTYALRERMRELEAQGRPTLYVSPQTYAGLEADLRAMKPDLTFSVPRWEAFSFYEHPGHDGELISVRDEAGGLHVARLCNPHPMGVVTITGIRGSPTASRASSPAVSASGSPWRGRSSTGPRCCSSTSRSAPST